MTTEELRELVTKWEQTRTDRDQKAAALQPFHQRLERHRQNAPEVFASIEHYEVWLDQEAELILDDKQATNLYAQAVCEHHRAIRALVDELPTHWIRVDGRAVRRQGYDLQIKEVGQDDEQADTDFPAGW